jgi:hypothetical protein
MNRIQAALIAALSSCGVVDVTLDRKMLVAGAVCFLLFFIAMFPARTLFAVALPDSVQGFGVEGSIWNGSARIINVAGQQLRNTEWNLAIARVLLGQFGGDIKTRWGGGFAEGFATVSLGGTLRLTDAQTAFDAGMLRSMLNTPEMRGQVSLDIQELEVVDNWPRRLTGKGEIRNFSSPLMGRGTDEIVSNISIEFDSSTETEEGTVTGRISDAGGPLEIKGTLQLKSPGSYELNTRVKARPDAPRAIRVNLRFLGEPDAEGNYTFKLEGSV